MLTELGPLWSVCRDPEMGLRSRRVARRRNGYGACIGHRGSVTALPLFHPDCLATQHHVGCHVQAPGVPGGFISLVSPQFLSLTHPLCSCVYAYQAAKTVND